MREENKWKSFTSMETPRKWFGATALGEKIYVAGGCTGSISSAEVYDIKTKKWSPLPDMKETREGCAVTSLPGKVYVIGGDDGRWRLSSGEMFDPVINK